jgi:hypothetical protein
MDTQTARIVSAMFDIIVGELSEEARQRVFDRLHRVSKSPLVRDCDRAFYALVHDTLTRPAVEIADEIIKNAPERASRLHPLVGIEGGANG